MGPNRTEYPVWLNGAQQRALVHQQRVAWLQSIAAKQRKRGR